VQGTAGFAYSLFAVPLLLMAGYDCSNAVALSLLASLIQKLTMVFKFRLPDVKRRLEQGAGCVSSTASVGSGLD